MSKLNESEIKTDCRYFSGYKPCPSHKLDERTCHQCNDYKPIAQRILIIKTGAAGDVLRTTPILYKLRETYPEAEISWITYFPDLIDKKFVDHVLTFTWQNCLTLQSQNFDLVLSLDKSHVEASLAGLVQAKVKKGFGLDQNGNIYPFDSDAESKWLTGFRDDLMKSAKKHYVEEIFEVCGFSFSSEEYIIPRTSKRSFQINKSKGKVIGLNTGCGSRWTTRLWSEAHFAEVARWLLKSNYEVVLLGGPEEDLRNQNIAKASGAKYFGVFDIPDFISLVDHCDIVVSSVTFGFHIGLALKKQIVLLNNIFPVHEFHLYGRGEILEPGLACQACFKPAFDNRCESQNCMDLISPNRVLTAVRAFENESVAI